MLTDEELINGCAKNDRAAQKALYDQYSRKMMVICQRYSKTLFEAEDTLQEGFMKVFSNIEKFKRDSQLGTWMTRIMINTSLNKQRQKLYLLPMVDVTETVLTLEEDFSLADFHLQDLLRMIQSLPDRCRIVFNLFAIEGYKHKEIGEMLNVSVGTSKSQFNRAKSLLREKIGSKKNLNAYGKAKI